MRDMEDEEWKRLLALIGKHLAPRALRPAALPRAWRHDTTRPRHDLDTTYTTSTRRAVWPFVRLFVAARE